MLFAGRVIDKLGTKAGFTIAIIIWSIGAMMHAGAEEIGSGVSALFTWIGIGAVPVAIAGFMVARAVLGLGESGNFPAAIKATAEYFPKEERSFATGIFNSGANIGAILAPIAVPWIAATWNWKMAFILVGAVGFIWLLFWKIYYEVPLKQRRLSAAELEYIQSDKEEPPASEANMGVPEKVSWFRLLEYKQTWAFAFGKMMTDGVWWFFLFWLPKYLEAKYDIRGTEIMLPLAVLYSMTMVGSIGGGYFPMYFIKKGFTPYDGRMKAMLLIAFFPLVVLLAQPLGHFTLWIPVILIGIGASAHQAWSANIFTTVSDMFPKKAIGSVIGIGGMAGGLGGVAISKIGGALFDHYKKLGHIETGYTIMFAFCAVAYLIAWVVMKSLVPKYKPITDL
jgi:ACS family hexuronate transporter-like MFS transporter